MHSFIDPPIDDKHLCEQRKEGLLTSIIKHIPNNCRAWLPASLVADDIAQHKGNAVLSVA